MTLEMDESPCDREQPSISAVENETEPDFQPGKDFYLGILALAVILLGAALNLTSVSVALPVRLKKL